MKADYLVATTEHSWVARAMWNWAQELEGRTVGRTMLGANGVYRPERGVFVGRWESAGRVMLAVSGEEADAALTMLAANRVTPDEVSVARLDLQWTVLTEDADAVIRAVRAKARFSQRLIDPAPARGVTRYIGSRSSERMLRVYNKSVQANLDIPTGELVRWELELKNSQADAALGVLVTGGRTALEGYAQAMLDAMVREAPVLSAMAEYTLPETQVGAGYSKWLASTVLPALRKLALRDATAFREFLTKVLDVADIIGEEPR